jgi:diketogulonate reductase-like aldo/keto reductase
MQIGHSMSDNYLVHNPSWCKLAETHGITLAAFGTLRPLHASPFRVVDPIITEIANRQGLTEAQVLLLWGCQTTGRLVVTSVSTSTSGIIH